MNVIDGDSLIVSCQTYEGILGIVGVDAPEIGQEYGTESRKCLEKLTPVDSKIFVKQIDLRTKRGEVISYNGYKVSSRLISQGCAWVNAKVKTPNTYLKKLEKLAKKQKLGLWSKSNKMPPWEFRKRYNIVDNEGDWRKPNVNLGNIGGENKRNSYIESLYSNYRECYVTERNKALKGVKSPLYFGTLKIMAEMHAEEVCAPLRTRK
ncbi:thermonuclease family protein [Geothermobacter ehrlichii]|uniref:thermonuclease family protein n=1 Tax=Geothermobacter ehrlichii TaxID=213224 RepID=UPI0016533E60|nr:thermonuclease family protein [Geothermobacter ehrlichii]